MAIFSKHDTKNTVQTMKKNSGATIISAGTKIKGDISLSSSFHIDGEVEGIILSDNIITIGSKGSVTGEIKAKSVVINGVLRGSVESNTIEILPKGNVKGKLVYKELTIEKGASFVGETLVLSAETSNDEGKISEISAHKKSDNPQKAAVKG